MKPDNDTPLTQGEYEQLTPYEQLVLTRSETKLNRVARRHGSTREQCFFQTAPSGCVSLTIDGKEVHWFFDADELCRWILSDDD